MKGSFRLTGVVLCLVLAEGQAGRGALPPKCEDCKCAHSQAWGEVGKTASEVLATYDPNNPDDFGAVTSTAKWFFSGGVNVNVYSAFCLSDFHEAEAGSYKKWTFSTNWENNCTGGDGGSYYSWITRAYAESANRTSAGLDTRYTCGTQ